MEGCTVEALWTAWSSDSFEYNTQKMSRSSPPPYGPYPWSPVGDSGCSGALSRDSIGDCLHLYRDLLLMLWLLLLLLEVVLTGAS